MQVGMIGLGRMGANMVRRLMRGGHDCVVHDVSADAIATLEGEGATGAETMEDFVAKLDKPRCICLRPPAAVVDPTLDRLVPLLDDDDTVIDGGNSYYRDDIVRARALREKGLHYVDMGTSGGVFGLERGYCLMIGGDDTAVERLDPFFKALAPGVEVADRTPGRDGEPEAAEHGYLHCGPSGAGHFVKMVHNGIEYGMMAAFAEGLNIIKQAGIGRRDHVIDAETTPLREPELYQYEFDIPAIAEGPGPESFSGGVSDSGGGRWTAHAAIDEGVPAPVLTASLFSRFASRGEDDFANKLLSAMRFAFGGH